MPQESKSRFASDQQTILQTLDPIHRSLLMNNSEFCINHSSSKTLNQSLTSNSKKLQQQPQQPLLRQQQQQTQQRKHQQKNSIENKHSGKPDAATCVNDSNCLTLFDESRELECTPPPNDKQPTQTMKRIQIRIVTTKRQPSVQQNSTERMPLKSRGYSPKERTSSESSSYGCVDTDSEIELSSEVADEQTENSGSNTNAEEFSDDSISYGSPSNDDATTTSSNSYSTAPMIQIVQQVTRQRTIVSTVQLNKLKVSNFQTSKADTKPVLSTGRPQWLNKQKIIEDNVCNELLDETINSNVTEGEKPADSLESPPLITPYPIVYKKLSDALPKKPHRKMGKLLERRMRHYGENDHGVNLALLSTLHKNEDTTDTSDTLESPRSTPPAKPPRTFTSNSSRSSSSSIGANTTTTLPIGDQKSLPSQRSSKMSPGWVFDKNSTTKPTCPTSDHKSSPSQRPSQMSPGWVFDKRPTAQPTCPTLNHKSSPSQRPSLMSPSGGWVFDKRSTTKPTCPTLDEDDMNDFVDARKIGWMPTVSKRDEFSHVLNMLNDDHHSRASKMTSCNLTPEPQIQINRKEDIDQVDSSEPPKPTPRRSKQMPTDVNDSMCTPEKCSNQFLSHSAPNSATNEMEFCKKCKLQIIEPSSARKSFGKGAMERTKKFFQASKNMLVKSKPKQPKSYENCSVSSGDLMDDDNIDATPSKSKFNTTVDFNNQDTVKFEKKVEKALELTPKHLNVDGARRILDKLTAKLSPPKKPIRQSLAHKDVARSPSNNEDEENFDFDRIVDSPKTKAKEREKSFRLSPRKLLFSANERSNDVQQQNSYRSFEADEQEDLKHCLVEYLRAMNERIEDEQDELESASVSRLRSRARNFSTSSDAIDGDQQHQRIVEIDCHPEPMYSEIAVKPPVTILNHIMVNDNPKAIYTTVNKAQNRNVVTPMTTVDDVDEHQSSADEDLYKSSNSLDKLSINNNFADSVFNMLALMNEQKSDEDSQRQKVANDSRAQPSAPQLAQSYVVETPVVRLTSEKFQQSAAKDSHPNAIDDNISTDTFFTESLCDDVIRGDSVNKNIVKDIVSAYDHLENLVSKMALAEPETDDEIDFHCMGDGKMDSKDDSAEYWSIIDGLTSHNPTMVKRSAQKIDSLHSPRSVSKLPGNRRIHNSLSPLVAAPSMIEIPDQFMLKLTGQIIAQREIRNQLKQAIQVCRTTKEFECSTELIEAERLMLLSAKKESCAKLELTRIDYEENGLTASPAKCAGMVTIKNIEFDLKPEERMDQIFQLSYICVCSYRDQVVATHSQERIDNTVRFDDISLKIGSLNCEFKIRLEVFVLRLPRQLRKFSHESKYHLNKIPKKPLFPNPVKMFANATASSSKSIPKPEESRFRLRGTSTISANCLSSEKFEIVRNTSWPKQHVYVSYNTKSLNLKVNGQFANMTGALQTEFICEVSLNDSGLAGYLDIESENSTRRGVWCRLAGCRIEGWSNDINCLDGKAPMISIDLIKCTNESFELANYKFAVDIFNYEMVEQTDENRVKRYWLSGSNQNDLILWLTNLNRILNFIREWNIH